MGARAARSLASLDRSLRERDTYRIPASPTDTQPYTQRDSHRDSLVAERNREIGKLREVFGQGRREEDER